MAAVEQSGSDRKEYFSTSELSKFLKPLDDALRCHICFEYFTNSMMTKCSHNYCSLCIRRYMGYKTQCPICFQVASEPELQNNRLIDEILEIYKILRNMLQLQSETFNQSHLYSVSSDITMTVKDISESISTSDSQSSNSCFKRNCNDNEVPCPVCNEPVLNGRINFHLDSCLKQSQNRSERKTLPKLVYHLMSDKELKKKLKEHGLVTSGNRQTMIKRHKNFLLQYNANCDSLNPKPVSEILLEIEKQELEERTSSSQTQKSTAVNRRSDPAVIEKENESYIKEHQSQYDSLISDIQVRRSSRLHKRELCSEDSSNSSSCSEPEKTNDSCAFKMEILNSVKKEIIIPEEESSSSILDTTGKVVGKCTLSVKDFESGEPAIDVQGECTTSSLDDFDLSQLLSQRKQTSHKKKRIKKLSIGQSRSDK